MSKLAQNFEAGGLVRLIEQVTVNPGSISNGALGTVAVTVTGLTSACEVLSANCKTILELGLQFKGAVCSTDTVTITLENTSGAPIDGASETWNIEFLMPFALQTA